ncbi:hypothetical protein [Gracilimonas sp.]|uniref:hypothetical protein n=1 Tax=Gracilimonas sp. TaxID=1974203 RepID=UPI0028724AC1|nr:hypothetical protein [Gracilimonas sp.]
MSNDRKKINKRLSKNRKSIRVGPRGGKYYISDNGNKVYVTKAVGKTTTNH